MFYPSGCYRKTRDLRIRPIPEMEVCLVFTPASPRLHTLNATAWLVLELCDGRTGRAIRDAYASVIASLSPDQVKSEIQDIMQDLEGKGIIERSGNSEGSPKHKRRSS